MTVLTWDEVGERFYETGVDHGVLYIPNEAGEYDDGVAWNGLVSVTESPSGAEATPTYADNIKYLNLISAETFEATLEAYTYPVEWEQFDGLASPKVGVVVGQQTRKSFGLSYRTRKGNDLEGDDLGYKLHMVYGCTAAPSEKAYTTVNDSPEAITFSWTINSLPVPVTNLRPTSILVIDSTQVNADDLAALELILYGDVGVDPALPTPDEVLALFDTVLTSVTPNNPTYNSGTDTLTIVPTTGVTYYNHGVEVSGSVVVTEDPEVTISLAPGYVLAEGADDYWHFTYVP